MDTESVIASIRERYSLPPSARNVLDRFVKTPVKPGTHHNFVSVQLLRDSLVHAQEHSERPFVPVSKSKKDACTTMTNDTAFYSREIQTIPLPNEQKTIGTDNPVSDLADPETSDQEISTNVHAFVQDMVMHVVDQVAHVATQDASVNTQDVQVHDAFTEPMIKTVIHAGVDPLIIPMRNTSTETELIQVTNAFTETPVAKQIHQITSTDSVKMSDAFTSTTSHSTRLLNSDMLEIFACDPVLQLLESRLSTCLQAIRYASKILTRTNSRYS